MLVKSEGTTLTDTELFDLEQRAYKLINATSQPWFPNNVLTLIAMYRAQGSDNEERETSLEGENKWLEDELSRMEDRLQEKSDLVGELRGHLLEAKETIRELGKEN